jgi:RHS repeat-associated protein
MTSKTRVSDGENWSYTWDDRNRLTQVVEKSSSGTTITNDIFTYDVENRRIGKSVNGTQTWYSYDPSLPSTSGRGDGGEGGAANIYADFNGSGSLTMRYLTGQALDSVYARFDGTNTGWYLDDMLGSVRQVANTSGTVLDTLTYDSYGQLLSESNSSNGDRFKYTSREWDSEIGQYFYRARPYSSVDGRFSGQDPKTFSAGDTNLYRYVKNRPVVFTDPSGRDYIDQLYAEELKAEAERYQLDQQLHAQQVLQALTLQQLTTLSYKLAERSMFEALVPGLSFFTRSGTNSVWSSYWGLVNIAGGRQATINSLESQISGLDEWIS